MPRELTETQRPYARLVIDQALRGMLAGHGNLTIQDINNLLTCTVLF